MVKPDKDSDNDSVKSITNCYIFFFFFLFPFSKIKIKALKTFSSCTKHDGDLKGGVGNGRNLKYKKNLFDGRTHFYVFGFDGAIASALTGTKLSAGQDGRRDNLPFSEGKGRIVLLLHKRMETAQRC